MEVLYPIVRMFIIIMVVAVLFGARRFDHALIGGYVVFGFLFLSVGWVGNFLVCAGMAFLSWAIPAAVWRLEGYRRGARVERVE